MHPWEMAEHSPHAKITLQRLRNFIAVVDEGTITSAARLLGEVTGEGSPSSVRQNLQELRSAFGGRQLLVEHNGKQVPTDLGESLLRYARTMVELWKGASRLGTRTLTLAFLPQHAFFISPVILELERSEMTVHSRILGEQDRSTIIFESHVIGALAGGEIDLVVGPPPEPSRRREELKEHRLYTSRLEAMLPGSDTRDRIGLDELIHEGPLLVPPGPTRSRRLLNRSVRAAGLPAPMVKLDAYSSKALVAFGEDRHGTVVIPSDIADPFKEGNILAGPKASTFRWVPVVDADGRELTQEVYATTRGRPPADIVATVDAIRRSTDAFSLDVAA
ncbi:MULTISPECIES: LysR family transcriptional regulator [unclassified Streptomyces]|uniref:LysR family transcriptional regulator n=2 Tax=unclassified Streptomyces TaxID=2593676 RepID=UPI0013315641|nr:LysR family transcriptional regulator [Streptomyces sp. Sge12]